MKIMIKTIKRKEQSMRAALIGVAVLALMTACSSDDNSGTSARTPAKPVDTHNKVVFDHAHGKEVTDLEKHKFEHQFADECVAREIKESVNRDVDQKRFAKPCMCIAKFMMKDLTAKEAEKFLKEHKNTQSLRIRYDNAAYHCLQERAQPKLPNIIGKR